MEKLGNTFSKGPLVSPLNAEPGKPDPGPSVRNSPRINASDPLGFMSGVGSGKKGNKKGIPQKVKGGE